MNFWYWLKHGNSNPVDVMVGKNLRQYREEKLMSLHRAAQYAGIDKKLYRKMEKGKSRPTPEQLALIAQILTTDVRLFLRPRSRLELLTTPELYLNNKPFKEKLSHDETIELIEAFYICAG